MKKGDILICKNHINFPFHKIYYDKGHEYKIHSVSKKSYCILDKYDNHFYFDDSRGELDKYFFSIEIRKKKINSL